MPTASNTSNTRLRARSPRRPLWRARLSPICSPTVSTGLSEVMGSWKIMAMRLPRTSRIATSGSAIKSRPASSTSPLTLPAACGGKRRMMLSAVIDLPQPDSPSSAKVSPRRTSKLTPSTARMARLLSNQVRRSRTDNRMSFMSATVSSISGRRRRAPHRKRGWRTNQGEHEDEGREQRPPHDGLARHLEPRGIDHIAPAVHGGVDADADIRQHGLGQHQSAEIEHYAVEYDVHDIRQDVTIDDLEMPDA